jgi:hypothetical protein
MTSTDLVPRSGEGDSALEAFLSRTVIHELAGAAIPRDLLRFGLYGSIVVIATGVLGLVFPDADSIRRGSFFLIFSAPAADMRTIMHVVAIPLIACGVALLLLDLYMMQGRRSEHWRSVVVAQATAGGIGGVVSAVFLALVIINLVLWIVLVACVVGMALVLGDR